MKGRRIIPLAATAALACGGMLAVTPAAHAHWTGTIVGKVLNADGTPARYVHVQAAGVDDGVAGNNDGSGDGYTDANGVYRINDIDRNNSYTLTLPNFGTVTGQPATGTIGQVTSGPTFTLPTPPTSAPIAVPADYSAVVSAVGGTPARTDVSAQNQATGTWYDADLATDGRFYFTDAPAGNYKFSADGFASNGEHLGEVWSGNKTNERDASVVAIGTKTDLGSLTIPSDEVHGTVNGNVAVPRVAGFDEWYGDVTFYSMDGKGDGVWAGGANLDAAGNFSATLSPGTYYASASGSAYQVTNFGTFANGTNNTSPTTMVNRLASYRTAVAWYGGIGGNFMTAKKIVVGPNGTVNGINFSLTNSLKPLEKPMIKGKFKKGKKVSVTTGTWNQTDDLTFSYVWKEGSKIVGTSSSLKLSKKVWKKAKKLTVVVTAHDKTGGMFDGTVTLPVRKTIKAQIKAAKKQLKKDTKKDKKALNQASKV